MTSTEASGWHEREFHVILGISHLFWIVLSFVPLVKDFVFMAFGNVINTFANA